VPFDRLSPLEGQALAALRRDRDAYGILRPREDERLTIKSVSKDTALLLSTLRTASPLPQYAIDALGEQCDSVIGRMVLDGILEIEAHGTMLSGPAALELVVGERAAAKSEGVLAALSRRALQYAERLDGLEPAALSARLYAYNRIPASARWCRLLRDESAVEAYLGIRDGDPARMLADGWIVWRSDSVMCHRNGAATYKLYVSPACIELRAAFAATAQAVSRSASFCWKVGANVYGLLRPDKIVIYFQELDAVHETAAYLTEKLKGCPAHGVPFTAELGAGALLSWGVDPPEEEDLVPWLERESWRLRICNRLAAALVLAKTFDAKGISPSRFAVERLRLEGIDTDTWSPI
jgi:hypothetical protein